MAAGADCTPLRNDLPDWWGEQILKTNMKEASSCGGGGGGGAGTHRVCVPTQKTPIWGRE